MRASIDRLENRQLFSFTITNAIAPVNLTSANAFAFSAFTTFKVSKTGTLFVSGTSKADKITVHVKNGRLLDSPSYFVSDVDAVVGTSVRSATGSLTGTVLTSTGLLSNTKIKRVDVSGLGGSDVISVVADVPVSVRGAAGSDTISVYAPQRTIVGGSGSNTIRDGEEASAPAELRVTFGSVFAYPVGGQFVTPTVVTTAIAPTTTKKHSPHGG